MRKIRRSLFIFLVVLFLTASISVTNATRDSSFSIYLPLILSQTQQPTIARVSLAFNGEQANNHSENPDVSADGRYIAFASDATNLVPNDTNDLVDIFVYDRVTAQIERVSVSSDGQEGMTDGFSSGSFFTRVFDLSDDGRYVAFASEASNLITGDTNKKTDIFVRDRLLNTTTRLAVLSSGADGQESNGTSFGPSISTDGRYVAFLSMATNLVPNQRPGFVTSFLHDRQTGQTIQLGRSFDYPKVSSDGTTVAFTSSDDDLVVNDLNERVDVFVYEISTGQISRVSVATSGVEGNDDSFSPAISGDGQIVTFASRSTNLIANGTDNQSDIFVHDRRTGETILISASEFGNAAQPAISANGRYVSFTFSGKLTEENPNQLYDDIYRYDRETQQLLLIPPAYLDSNGFSKNSTLSADGAVVVFASGASNLVLNDTNVRDDIFLYEVPAN